MGDLFQPALVRLSRSDLAIEDPLGDARGRQVIAADDEWVGTVADLLVDRREQSIRFLEVDLERLDEVGPRTILLPAQVVDRGDEHDVYLGCAREQIATAPTYNPHVVLTDPYLDEVYEHFGCQLPRALGTET
jgi:hypothetical protein